MSSMCQTSFCPERRTADACSSSDPSEAVGTAPSLPPHLYKCGGRDGSRLGCRWTRRLVSSMRRLLWPSMFFRSLGLPIPVLRIAGSDFVPMVASGRRQWECGMALRRKFQHSSVSADGSFCVVSCRIPLWGCFLPQNTQKRADARHKRHGRRWMAFGIQMVLVNEKTVAVVRPKGKWK